MSETATQHIVRTPGAMGGRPHIAGHRIRVQDIVFWHEKRGRSVDEIVADFPGLSLAQVYSALAYYFDNRDEIDDAFTKDEIAVERARAVNPSPLQEKLKRLP